MMAWEPSATGFLLVLFRTTSLFMTAPLLGTQTIATRVRLGTAMVVAMVAYTASGSPRFEAWEQMVPLFNAVIAETLIGLSVGMCSRFVIEAAGAAGHAAGLSMGLGFSSLVDPLHGQESTVISQMLVFVSLGTAVAMGIHRDAIAWLCRSFIETPPGSALDIQTLTGVVIAEAARATSLSIRLAFPVLAAVIFGYVVSGVLGRAAPQMNLSNIGYAIALLAGGAALYYVAPVFAEIIAMQARAVFADH